MKGISPFIATVLIISFTIGAGVLLGPWIYSLTKSQAETIGGETETRLDCQYGGIRIDDECINIDFSGDPYFLNFTLENTGTVDLYDFKCEIYQDGLIYSYSVNDSRTNTIFTKDSPLGSRESRIVSVNLNTSELSSANPDWVRIIVTRCPTVSDKVTNLDCS